MATTKTRAELVAKVLANLGVLQAGQSPSDEDAATVDGYIDTSLATIAAKGLVTIYPSAIQPEFFIPIAVLIASDCAHEFGAVAVSGTDKAERDLRIMTRGEPTRATMKTDYF